MQRRQDSGHSNFSYASYAEKLFTQIYKDLYGDAMLVPMWIGTNMAAGNRQKHLSLSFAKKKCKFISRGTLKTLERLSMRLRQTAKGNKSETFAVCLQLSVQ